MNDLKTVNVVAAVICDSLNTKSSIFATARGYGEFKGLWEFPGGKIEQGETSHQALIREIREELDVQISIGNLIKRIEWDYDNFHLSMDCFWCEIVNGEPTLLEAEACKWFKKDDLYSVPWLPADMELVSLIAKQMT